jgi:hypothetical protein
MKWFKRIARESVGCCRGAAIDHSPGLQPWVRQIERSACLSAVVLGKWDEGGKVAPDVRAIGGLNTPLAEHAPRSPLSGRLTVSPNPGLKPWAVLSDHFMVKKWHESVNVSHH